MFGKSSFRGLEPPTMIHADSLDKSIAEFTTVYKKMSALVWNRVYNHDFGLLLVQLYN